MPTSGNVRHLTLLFNRNHVLSYNLYLSAPCSSMAGDRWCLIEKKLSLNVILDSLCNFLKSQKRYDQVINPDFTK